MKSTLFNMVTVLFCITLIASAGVGGVNMLTEEKIAQANAAAETEAVSMVLPDFEEVTTVEQTIDEMPIVVNTATAGDQVIGYAIKTMTKKGFSGEISLMVGFDPDGKVLNVQVLTQNETPGLGSKMADEGNPLISSIKGKNPCEMKLSVTKDGGDVDALTAATISSRAYVDAIGRAFQAYAQVAGKEYKQDGVSGASQPEKEHKAQKGDDDDDDDDE
ncbi:MAG: RnfABCDGE type electron transport complex subunit G [Alistipes sp.]